MAEWKDRVTVIETIHHQSETDPPITFSSIFSQNLYTIDQPYQRKIIVHSRPEKLDLGWLQSKASMLVLQNREGMNLTVIPTKEERDLIDSRVIEVFDLKHPDSLRWVIPPGQSLRMYPSDCDRIGVQCKIFGQSANAVVFAVPM